jgi:pimeloyl-ACP methyl ester carboxylesterase
MRTLFLLSGLLCDETVWSDVAQRLTDLAEIRIVDFPSLDSMSAMAEKVLRGAPAQFAVAGHSMGGRVALEVMRQAPGRVDAIALLNTGAHPCRAGEHESRGRLVKLAMSEGMSRLAAEWLPPMMGASPQRVAQVLPTLTSMVEKQSPASFAAQTRALLDRPDARPVLGTIRVPALLLSGTADTWSPLAQHEEMRQQLSNATLVAVEDAGHMSLVEQPAAVAAALRTILIDSCS